MSPNPHSPADLVTFTEEDFIFCAVKEALAINYFRSKAPLQSI